MRDHQCYVLHLVNGSTIHTTEAGDIVRDGERGMAFAPDGRWRVLGVSTRFNARAIITLAQAAAGADIGQGWVHDRDHGTHRVWGSPRVRRVERAVREDGACPFPGCALAVGHVGPCLSRTGHVGGEAGHES